MSIQAEPNRTQIKPFRQNAIYGLIIVTSVALTLGFLKIFPGFLSKQFEGNTEEFKNRDFSANEVSSNFVIAAVNQVGPAVVRIDTETIVRSYPGNSFFEDPFLRNFFGEDILPRFPKNYRQFGQGSGFIFDRNGLILTNAHVVSAADKVTVRLRDGRTFQGEVRGIDELSDLAVIKIEGENLPVAPLGDSRGLQVGEWAIAVGNPFGLDNTVTLGIISTLNRSSAQVGIADVRLDFIQTDVAINPGNSGGPLLNSNGQVIGINTAIRDDAEGIGFAIPIARAKEIQARLTRGETIPYPFIGVRVLSLTPEMAQKLNQSSNPQALIPQLKGVLVIEVVSNSPAEIAGLRQGDVITSIADSQIETARELQESIETSKIGQSLTLQIRRGDRRFNLSITPIDLQSLSLLKK